jgi:hypothetical protein
MYLQLGQPISAAGPVLSGGALATSRPGVPVIPSEIRRFLRPAHDCGKTGGPLWM